MTGELSLFRNAVTESDGHSVNIGYLSLWNLMTLDIVLSIVFVAAGFVAMAFDEKHVYPFKDVAWALTGLWGTFATALTAMGVFLWGDRRPSAQSPGTLTQTTQTTITADAGTDKR